MAITAIFFTQYCVLWQKQERNKALCAALDTVDARQESIVDALLNDIKNAWLQLSRFLYANEGECMQTVMETFQAEAT